MRDKWQMGEKVRLVRLMVAAGLAESGSKPRRLIEAGALELGEDGEGGKTAFCPDPAAPPLTERYALKTR